MTDKRQTNIELCRLVSILCVMFVHTTMQSLGFDVTIWINLLEAFTVIGVNVFILITGYFSTTPKKTNLINLAFICFFWMVVKLVCHLIYSEPIRYKHLFFVTTSNWFIPSYIGLLFLSPILNKFCNSVNKITLWRMIFVLLFIEIWFDWMPPYPNPNIGTQNGFSTLSFVVLYLLARAIRLYGLPLWFKKLSPIIYVLCSIFLAAIAHVFVRFGHPDLCFLWFAYVNPLIIISTVAFFSMFEQLHIQSSFINYIAKSTLAVLLGHTAIFFLYTKQFKYLYYNYSGADLIALWTLAVAIVFFAIIAIDQIRLFLYKPIEKKMRKNIRNNNIFDMPE